MSAREFVLPARLQVVLFCFFAYCLFACLPADSLAQAKGPKPGTQSSLAMPVEPPSGWDRGAWARLRQSCLGIQEKILKREPLQNPQINALEMCTAYSNAYASPPTLTGNSLPPPPTFSTFASANSIAGDFTTVV
jgi:hypothetical protein